MGPNIEQLQAIEHEGGVLLKAGAGSGKTYVLVQHLVYLTRAHIFVNDKKKFKYSEECSQELVSFYKSMVLMTFTNKAAGELSIRIKKEFKKLESAYEGSQYNPWSIALASLSYLTVGTIHSFCFKLIKQGYFPEVNPEVNIINDSVFYSHLEKLFYDWLSLQEKSQTIKIISSQSTSVFKSMASIFQEPGLRLNWKKGEKPPEFGEVLRNIYHLSEFKGLFEEVMKIEAYDEFRKNKWYQFFEQFEQIKCGLPLTQELFFKYKIFFENNSFPQKRGALKEIDELVAYLDKIKSFKNFFFDKEEITSFEEYFLCEKKEINDWYKTLRKLFSFIEEHYYKIEGLTFSDLEYNVLSGIQNPQIAKKIAESYKYFIIDEFQDTSHVQFEIVSKIIDNNFQKLFCVGDEKQAIYGFRGGELGVFWECEKKIPKVLELKNNYRSSPNIIKFNNNLFQDLFQQGIDFEGKDLMSLNVVHQTVPEAVDYATNGQASHLTVNIEISEDDSMLDDELYCLEAELIVDFLKNEKKQTAILYKNLAPSRFLVEKLISNEMSFTAQIKVPYLNEPIIGIFYTLIESRFNKKDNLIELQKQLINAYLKILGFEQQMNIESEINNFHHNRIYYGLNWSFQKFIFDLGISNSNYQNNTNFIKNLIETTTSDEELYIRLRQAAALKFSIEVQFGQYPEKIKIMTAHASKGLEFPNVILGAIQKNSSRVNDKGLIGKLPGSFRWMKESASKKIYKTPMYFYEKLLNKHKEFAESKRLFYVVGTRAQDRLLWFDYKLSNQKTVMTKGSWFQGLEKWIQNNSQYINIESSIEVQYSKIKKDAESINKNIPLFHKQKMGIEEKIGDKKRLIFMSDLSVTKLASLSLCSRKFYLEQILKFDEKLVEQYLAVTNQQNKLESGDGISSSERGTLIHAIISESILNNWVVPRKYFESKEAQIVSWALGQLVKMKETHQFISEVALKFSFFGQIISGIPDLVLLHDQEAQVWDFKTGNPDESKNTSYWFQLKAYALAMYQLKRVSMDKPIKLVLCYVDKRENYEKIISYQQIKDELYQIWSTVERPDLKNLEHCSSCSFQKLCHL